MALVGEEDAGIDRQKLLDEIVGMATPPPSPAPSAIEAPPSDPSEPPASPAESPPALPAAETGGPSVPALARPGFLRHRHEVAALVTIFAGVVWLAAGLGAARGEGVLIGAAFLAAGALAGWGARNNA
jgi:hypothetical protein